VPCTLWRDAKVEAGFGHVVLIHTLTLTISHSHRWAQSEPCSAESSLQLSWHSCSLGGSRPSSICLLVDTLFYPNIVYAFRMVNLKHHDPILDRTEFLRLISPHLKRENRDRLICRGLWNITLSKWKLILFVVINFTSIYWFKENYTRLGEEGMGHLITILHELVFIHNRSPYS